MRQAVAAAIEEAPIVGVVRTGTRAEAAELAARFATGGIRLIEITFTVPQATELVRELLAGRDGDGPPFYGMGTVTDERRAEAAIAAGAEFLVSPNVSAEVAAAARAAQRFLVLGALTPTEIVAAYKLGADLVKVYPLPPVGGAAYLATVRQPIDDVPILAAGGFGIDEIPSYRAAGARAFGIGQPLAGDGNADPRRHMARALALARGETPQ